MNLACHNQATFQTQCFTKAKNTLKLIVICHLVREKIHYGEIAFVNSIEQLHVQCLYEVLKLNTYITSMVHDIYVPA